MSAGGEISAGGLEIGGELLGRHAGAALALALGPCGGVVPAELEIKDAGGGLLVELGGLVVASQDGAGIADFINKGFCCGVGLQQGEVFLGEVRIGGIEVLQALEVLLGFLGILGGGFVEGNPVCTS